MIRITPVALLLSLLLGASAPPARPPAATPSCPYPNAAVPSALFAMLYASNYICTEEIAHALAPLADDWMLARLLTLTRPAFHNLTRRNALRIVGRFAERPASSPAYQTVTHRARELRQRLFDLLQTDPDDDVRAEAIWILDTFFFPAHDAQPILIEAALGSNSGANLRDRAAYAVTRLMAVRPGLLAADDLRFLLDALRSADSGVRARAAGAIQRLRDEQLDPAARARVILALETAWIEAANLAPAESLSPAPPALHTARLISGIPETTPSPFSARAALARALDRFGGSRFQTLRAEFEHTHLPNRLDRPGLSIDAAIPAADLVAIVRQLSELNRTFVTIIGQATPIPSDSHPTLTLKLFADRSVYREYMLAFVGFGADFDGIYVEASATLYTYERGADETRNTTGETLAHEYGHYLAGRYLFPGEWNDAGYHDEPKGWIDEGIAEYLAGLAAPANGPRAALNRLCSRAALPDLARLLALRDGYDQYGTFAYDEAWAFITYLIQERPAAFQMIAADFRAEGYRQSDITILSGAPSLAALQTDWHTTIRRWCDER